MATMNDDNQPILQATQLQHINELSAAQNTLLLLRVLNTSDLTFQYMLLTKETCADIEKMASSLLALEFDSGMMLTPNEVAEYLDYCKGLHEYANS